MFISLEGGEGCGKSTQMQLLADALRAQGRQVLTTREPGGSPLSETLRAILLDPANSAISPRTELLLFLAARAQHLHETILPALAAGQIVLCDRFSDSTRAYQGSARALGDIESLLTFAAPREPDLTILLDIDPQLGLARSSKRLRDENAAHESRFEAEELSFHRDVAAAFRALAAANPHRWRVVDASQDMDAVARDLLAVVSAALEPADA